MTIAAADLSRPAILAEICDGGDHLVIRGGKREPRIELAKVSEVAVDSGPPPKVTLQLRMPSEFAAKISFLLNPTSRNPLATSSIAEDLVRRVRQLDEGRARLRAGCANARGLPAFQLGPWVPDPGLTRQGPLARSQYRPPRKFNHLTASSSRDRGDHPGGRDNRIVGCRLIVGGTAVYCPHEGLHFVRS